MRDLATYRYESLFEEPQTVRRLAAATIGQAILDARANTRRKDPNPGALKKIQQEALVWLNQPRAAQLAELIDLALPATVTPETLRATGGQRLRPQGRRKAVQP